MARRERTRLLIELGGLVVKADLVAITDDDRAMLYGALLDIAQRMRGDEGEHVRLLMKRRGSRAFADEAEQASERNARVAVAQWRERTGRQAEG